MARATQLIHPLSARRWSDADLQRQWCVLTAYVREKGWDSYEELCAVIYVNVRTLEAEILRRKGQRSLF